MCSTFFELLEGIAEECDCYNVCEDEELVGCSDFGEGGDNFNQVTFGLCEGGGGC